jgi:phosphoribosylaminoimidazole carboxylase/phosphoribosylaminoimidazole-succinocarboxamide synthase
MLPYHVVVRREARGSFLGRHPHVPLGHLLPQLVVEPCLTTQGRRHKSHEFPCEDPLMTCSEAGDQVQLFDPSSPQARPLLTLAGSEVFDREEQRTALSEVHRISRHAFFVLEKAWQLADKRLVELRLQFGLDTEGGPLLAKAVDDDSWRLIDGQGGQPPDHETADQKRIAELTEGFRVPAQRIILWRGSESDNLDRFLQALGDLDALATIVTCSAHKEPVAAASRLLQLVHEVPDSVVIAYIGRSNGAGPTLSATSTVPVITVPASVKDFPNDVWSSLRAPSKVPVMTVLEPSNAVLAALQILGARNPRIHARLRGELETRMVNMIRI